MVVGAAAATPATTTTTVAAAPPLEAAAAEEAWDGAWALMGKEMQVGCWVAVTVFICGSVVVDFGVPLLIV